MGWNGKDRSVTKPRVSGYLIGKENMLRKADRWGKVLSGGGRAVM